VNSIHNKWDLTFHIETNFGALSTVLEGLAKQIKQHGDTLNRFTQRNEMNFIFVQFGELLSTAHSFGRSLFSPDELRY